MKPERAIIVQNLSKAYRIGSAQNFPPTLAGQLIDTLRSPLDNFRRIRSMSNLDKQTSDLHWALRDVSFEVKKGEVLGIIGKNGSGKSTLLKILSRITPPTDGEIDLYGKTSSLLEIGTGFHPELTGRENIYMNGTLLGMKKREVEKQLDEIIDFSGITQYIDTPVKFYSSGMKVRLGFSIAAFLNTDILFVDEVLAVGDLDFQRKCLGQMDNIADSGKTILFVSHDMSAVQHLCKRSVLLENGQLIANGNTDEVISKYVGSSFSTETTLENHPNRKGSGSIKIKKIEMNKGDNGALTLSCGEEIIIDIWLDNPLKDSKPRVDVRIDSSSGQRLIWLSSSIYGESPLGADRLQFKIERNPLTEGQYYISIHLSNFGEVCDWIPQLMRVDISAGNPFGNGKSIPPDQSKMAIPFEINYP